MNWEAIREIINGEGFSDLLKNQGEEILNLYTLSRWLNKLGSGPDFPIDPEDKMLFAKEDTAGALEGIYRYADGEWTKILDPQVAVQGSNVSSTTNLDTKNLLATDYFAEPEQIQQNYFGEAGEYSPERMIGIQERQAPFSDGLDVFGWNYFPTNAPLINDNVSSRVIYPLAERKGLWFFPQKASGDTAGSDIESWRLGLLDDDLRYSLFTFCAMDYVEYNPYDVDESPNILANKVLYPKVFPAEYEDGTLTVVVKFALGTTDSTIDDDEFTRAAERVKIGATIMQRNSDDIPEKLNQDDDFINFQSSTALPYGYDLAASSESFEYPLSDFFEDGVNYTWGSIVTATMTIDLSNASYRTSEGKCAVRIELKGFEVDDDTGLGDCANLVSCYATVTKSEPPDYAEMPIQTMRNMVRTVSRIEEETRPYLEFDCGKLGYTNDMTFPDGKSVSNFYSNLYTLSSGKGAMNAFWWRWNQKPIVLFKKKADGTFVFYDRGQIEKYEIYWKPLVIFASGQTTGVGANLPFVVLDSNGDIDTSDYFASLYNQTDLNDETPLSKVSSPLEVQADGLSALINSTSGIYTAAETFLFGAKLNNSASLAYVDTTGGRGNLTWNDQSGFTGQWWNSDALDKFYRTEISLPTSASALDNVEVRAPSTSYEYYLQLCSDFGVVEGSLSTSGIPDSACTSLLTGSLGIPPVIKDDSTANYQQYVPLVQLKLRVWFKDSGIIDIT